MKRFNKLIFLVLLFTLSSCLKQGDKPSIPGVKGPSLNIQNGQIVISLNMTQIDTAFGLSFPIKKLKKSQVYIGPSYDPNGQSKGTLVKTSFSLSDVAKDDFNIVPSSTLPDGRPFPFLVDGKLPSYALHVDDAMDMTFYASKKVFGFFIPFSLPEDFRADISFNIVVNNKKYGIASLIHPDIDGEGSGLVVLLTLDVIRNDPGLQKLMRLSKKNKNRMY